MTKSQAIDRVCKLRALAKSTTSLNERDTATRQATVLMQKHKIKDEDLHGSGTSAAFDDIAKAFARYTSETPDLKAATSPTLVEIIEMVVGQTKKMSRGKKTVLLDQVNSGLRIA